MPRKKNPAGASAIKAAKLGAQVPMYGLNPIMNAMKKVKSVFSGQPAGMNKNYRPQYRPAPNKMPMATARKKNQPR